MHQSFSHSIYQFFKLSTNQLFLGDAPTLVAVKELDSKEPEHKAEFDLEVDILWGREVAGE